MSFSLRSIVSVVLKIFIALCVGYIISDMEIKAFSKQQQLQVEETAQAVQSELETYIKSLRHKSDVFQINQEPMLSAMVQKSYQVNKDEYFVILNRLKMQLDNSRLYTVVDTEGEGVFSHITGDFLESCEEEVKLFIRNHEQKSMFLHRSGKHQHFDVIIKRPSTADGELFFVAFNTDKLTEILNKYQISAVKNWLVSYQDDVQVELTPDYKQLEDIPKEVINQFKSEHFLLPIHNTQWYVASFPSAESLAKYSKSVWLRNLLILLGATILLWLAEIITRKK
ncbi:hypothetical protein [Flocculibacter collagenilyticus]|uniref:hypothetical protein n=1 Tax=Flocculibacter collagenilyticus TaxID=2744479 RepID=UPI0018F6C76E|nr:hypothetical protein [Flocculibacter collagenilyticus]